jgi:fucose permease
MFGAKLIERYYNKEDSGKEKKHMLTILLCIIYISFISLGLPDALLGSAWPSMYTQLQVPISYAGIISMVVAGGTIVSSLMSYKLIHRLGTGKVTAISVGMTALALFGFSVSNSFLQICLWAIPYGLGAGSVDAALNNFVAIHYKARHMNWLHCFWGVGASLGPYIMGYCLTKNLGWNSGYRYIFFIQMALTALLFLSLPLWKKNDSAQGEEQMEAKSLKLRDMAKINGIKPAMLAFLCYCGLETTTGLWGSSFMVLAKGISKDTAAEWVALFYLGITIGRFLSGFITMKQSDHNMVRIGQIIIILGTVTLMLPLSGYALCVGFVLIGLGCAPIYPGLLHATPDNFGTELSQPIMGMQMACAYIGSTFMPPLVGLLVEHISMSLYPIFLLAVVVLMIYMVERLYRIKRAEAG